MPIKMLMPALSPTMKEGKLGRWIKKEGEEIRSGDIIAEIETDKATMEWEATEDGKLGKIIVGDGTEGVEVNRVIGILLEEGEGEKELEEALKEVGNESNSKSFNREEKVQDVNNNLSSDSNKISGKTTDNNKLVSTHYSNISNGNIVNNPKENNPSKQEDINVPQNTNKRIFITPLAKRIASQNNIDLANVKGTGPNGRIIKHDIELALSGGGNTSNANSSTKGISETAYTDKPNTGIRKVIAKRLLESKNTIPHYYLTLELDVDILLNAREALNKSGGDKYKLSVNDFIIKAVALALQDIPEANASWMGETTRYYTHSDVAIAVATEGGLFTPIIKNAESKGIVEISNEMKALAKKAKEGKLRPEEYQGGSFSISNLGMFGIKEFNAIINPPHSGILAIGTTVQKPVVKNGNIVIGNTMNITLSADHRILDGAVGAKFLNAVKKYLEQPLNMIL